MPSPSFDESILEDRAMELAIVGMAGHFPGANDIDTFWENLKLGVESITFFSDEEVEAAGVDPQQLNDTHYVKAGGILDGAEYFDASFFSVYPREAAIMDPQHRVFLEVAWEALENAGYNPDTYPGWIGLFAGTGMNTYLLFNLLPNREIMDSVHGYQLTISSDKDFLPTRVSYKFNLRGPSVNVQSACSTSLVAVHLACQSLLSYQCDMALAGGVSIRQPQKTGYLYQEGGITSPDGHCRAFDARAAGTVYGNGAGTVVIKRLADAVKDGDTIHAIIKGSAINNDGSLKVGYTAPSVDGQAEVVSMAQAIANVDPATITYVETHGTGTALGDPIEIAALTQVFRASTEKNQFCGIGSVKTNIGHLDAAAGVTSLIKTTLALENQQIPPSLHFTRPNPKIDFDNSPFYVNTQLRDWETNGAPRRAGVSSFGIGGTNVHLILEEAAVLDAALGRDVNKVVLTRNDRGSESNANRPWKLLLLSARSTAALEKVTDNLITHFINHPEISLTNAAYTLQVGRKAFSQRRMLVCRDRLDAIQALESRDFQHVYTGAQHENGGKRHPQMVFMFSGQGAQYVNMARELYKSEPYFKEQVDRCAGLLQKDLGQDIRNLIFVDGAGAVETSENTGLDTATQILTQTAITQPALFVIEYSLAKLLIEWGIEPQAMIGHSIGEYVAACLGGIFSLEDALALVAARGRLMQSVAPGAMLSIPLSEAEVQSYLGPGLSLSAVNAPALCVVSGEFYRIEALINRLANDGVEYRRLRTSHAFHSSMMDAILEEFRHQFVGVKLSASSIPIISNLTGTWMNDQQATDPEYWVGHLRQTVRFSDGISELLRDPAWILLEVGPGQTLVTLAKSVLSAWADAGTRPPEDRMILSTIRPIRSPQPDQAFLLTTLGRLWMSGVEINWEAYSQGVSDDPERSAGWVERYRRVPLPTYPFERKMYWVEPDLPLYQLVSGSGQTPANASLQKKKEISARGQKLLPLQKRLQVSEWFYTPSWKRSDLRALPGRKENIQLVSNSESEPTIGSTRAHWLIFEDSPFGKAELMTSDSMSLGQAIENRCYLAASQGAASVALIRVWPGESFERLQVYGVESSAGNIHYDYQINPARPEDFQLLLHDLVDKDFLPEILVYLWNFPVKNRTDLPDTRQASATDLNAFLSLVQAFEKEHIAQAVQLAVVTSSAFEVIGNEELQQNLAGLTALCKVVSQEYPNLTCRNIDFGHDQQQDWVNQAASRIVVEMNQPSDDRFVAYRGNHRWVEVYEHNAQLLLGEESPVTMLHPGGVYMITGGLGRIALTLAEYLAREFRANLALIDRFDFPMPDAWETNLREPDSPTNQRIKSLMKIQSLGAEVVVYKADVTDFAAMKSVLQSVVDRFGTLNGVIHAAGLVGEAAIKPLSETHLQEIEAQFTPKVVGLQVLHDILLDHANLAGLDFVFLQSSLSAVLGGLGLGAYAAANAVMDAQAHCYNAENLRTKNNTSAPAWISVDWDGWRFGETGSEIASATTLAELTMTPEEGIQAFELALAHASAGDRRLVISTADLNSRIERWLRMSTSGRMSTNDQIDVSEAQGIFDQPDISDSSGFPAKPVSSGFARPSLQTPYVAPRSDLETQLVDVWQKVLGIVPIGVLDDFFELGGHSLLATQLVTRLRDMFKVELPLRRLFESPTIAGLAELILAFSAQSTQVEQFVGIACISRDGDLPLSFGQQRLWFIDQFEPGSSLYNNFAALRLSGELNRPAFEFSIREIIKRHESLRTTFSEQKGQPVQVIHETMVMPLDVCDLQNVPEDQLQDEITRLAIAEARKPFDLTTGPLFRIILLQTPLPDTDKQEHVIFMTMHHIVSDGWSVGVIVREIAALYSAYLEHADRNSSSPDPLPELPIQFADFAAWQREWLLGERLENQLNYWKEKLKDIQQLELFCDYPRPAVQSSHGANHYFELSENLSNGLVALSQQEGVTLFMTLLAALQTLLLRYTGQEDISVGTPIANRTQAEVENLIGFVLNTLVMRADCSGNPSFREFLGHVRETALGAYAHQDLPFEMLVEAVQPVRDMSRAPLFQVIFDLQTAPLQALNLPGLTISPIAIDGGTAKFDLALSLEEIDLGSEHGLKNTKIRGYLNYNTDLFEPATIARLVEHFQVLLTAITQNPETTLWQLPLLTRAEKEQLLTGWQQPSQPASTQPGLFIHEMIHQQALQAPTAIALSLAQRHAPAMTYQELDELSNQLAQYLIKLGVVPETLVGLCTERSLDMIVGLLGILKAGGAFLPLDPSYPTERLAFMLTDSRAPLVLTQETLLVNNPGVAALFDEANHDNTDVKVVCLDRDWPEIASFSGALASNVQAQAANSLVELNGDNLAYVIYTSGSTGKPKGVMVTHQAVADHCRDMSRHFEIHPQDRVLQFASLNFDAGLEQIFTALLAGAWLIVRDNDVWPAEEFHAKIDQLGLTVVNVPPAYWQPWVQYVAELEANNQGSTEATVVQSLPTLRLVIIGGDLMLTDTLQIWWKTSLRTVRLLNAYGPTETVITASTYQVPDHPVESLAGSHYARIPIGNLHTNRTAYILDRAGNLLPVGLPGELHLGGPYLARGYLNRPELTAEKFITNPFMVDRSESLNVELSGSPTSLRSNRLYRTGDLVRRLADGTLDFVGRLDQQVKLRGFRIELGEIEAVVGAHPSIEEAAVVIQTDPGGDKRLIAYVIPAPSAAPDVDDLAGDLYEFVREQLPTYMVPAAFIQLESLPLSPSGKVNRQALSAMLLPDQTIAARKRKITPPRSPLEQEVLDLWAEVLKIQTSGDTPVFGIFDNFFELGGHSLLATQVVSRLRENYQVELPLRELFENPTVAGIAALIAQSLVAEEDEEDLAKLLAELEQMSDDEARESLGSDHT